MSSLGVVIIVSPLWRGDGAWRREHLQNIYDEYSTCSMKRLREEEPKEVCDSNVNFFF